MRATAGLGVALLVLTACGTAEKAGAGRGVVKTPPGVVVDSTCGRSFSEDGGGGCNIGFALDSVNYRFECVPVRPESVSANQLGAGTRDGQPIVVRQITGVDRAVAVAVGNNLRACRAAGRRPPAAWVFGLPSRPIDGGGHLPSLLCRHGALAAAASKANACPRP